MKKIILTAFTIGMFTSAAAFAKNGDIYGWRIQCTDVNGLQVFVEQADDDVSLSVYNVGQEVYNDLVYASLDYYDSSTETLNISSEDFYQNGPYKVSFSVIRENVDQTTGQGKGTLDLNGIVYNDLSCRIAEDKEN